MGKPHGKGHREKRRVCLSGRGKYTRRYDKQIVDAMNSKVRINNAGPRIVSHPCRSDLVISVRSLIVYSFPKALTQIPIFQVPDFVCVKSLIQDPMRLNHALHVLIYEAQIDHRAQQAEAICIPSKSDSAVRVWNLFRMIVQGVLATFVRN